MHMALERYLASHPLLAGVTDGLWSASERDTGGRPRRCGVPLYWRVFLLNAVVFVSGTTVLALSPATVSSPVLATEVLVLAGGLVVILVANAVLLRVAMAPLDRLTNLMKSIDLLRPGQ